MFIQTVASIFLVLFNSLFFYGQLIREINLYCDSFDGHIVQKLKLSCTKLLRYLNQQQKENIDEGNAPFQSFYILVSFLILEEQTFYLLEHLIMKRYKHSKKLLLNDVSNFFDYLTYFMILITF